MTQSLWYGYRWKELFLPHAEHEYKWCQFSWSEVLTLETSFAHALLVSMFSKASVFVVCNNTTGFRFPMSLLWTTWGFWLASVDRERNKCCAFRKFTHSYGVTNGLYTELSRLYFDISAQFRFNANHSSTLFVKWISCHPNTSLFSLEMTSS